MAIAQVRLDDKYTLERGRIYLSGIQALVRLPIVQRRRDRAAGLNTAGFVSGYRGSPLGGLDLNLWRAREHLERHHVRFQPGLNEELAATAIWGTQQLHLHPGARYDGVFALWYGKGPGVDRSGDVFKHANAAGTAPHGGVLVVAGDDHACKSSTLPHQSEYAFMDARIPVLNPAGVQELLDYGLIGFALSRYSGCWVGFKAIAETVDCSATVDCDPERVAIRIPEDFEMPPGGLHIRWPDPPLEQELRLQRYKLYAALAFARANRLDRLVIDSPRPRLGIITTGKSYLDCLQALEDLGIDEELAAAIGLRLYKVGMSWPLERDGVRAFARGLEEVLVVEEKRAVIENQLKEQLYNWSAAVRPRVIGKFDEQGRWVLPESGELTPARIARVIAARVERFFTSERIQARLRFLEAKERALARPRPVIERKPHFCSGCPHNTSTRLPAGSRATGGIGCHYMATWMERGTETFTQMGGEGAPWIGQAPFTETAHIFANLGDGTYFHSGLLAIRAALAAGVSITYKILYNDAVAMTGGQPLDGALTVPQLTRQLRDEGVERIALVSDEPGRYRRRRAALAPGVTVHHRRELDAVQRELRERRGVTVLIYEQTCAAEKRRRRKRGRLPDPPRRVFINAAVCEGCGDCSVQSNCLSVIPRETPLGRKRAIDQSACNKDFSCLEGLCPSFVTVHGARLRRPPGLGPPGELPAPPARPALERPYNVLITGVGGTGVVTVGALLGMAAHLEGRAATVLDMTGLAQKYGAVVSHLRIGAEPGAIHAPRIPAGEADLLLGCDLVVAAGFEALAKLDRERSHAVVNDHPAPTADFVRDPDAPFPTAALRRAVARAVGRGRARFVDAGTLATAALGDAIAANLFMVGYAWQLGLLPLSLEAIERAIELNGVAVEMNKAALAWGRWAALDEAAVRERLAERIEPPPPREDLAARIERRARYLAAYQDQAYAERYRALLERVRVAERRRAPGCSGLLEAVASGYFRALAIKDEYEVARLYTSGEFRRDLERHFEGDYRIEVHLAPPLLARPDPVTGRPRKRAFGPWVLAAMRLLARLRRLRNTPLDPFARSPERRLDRALLAEYEESIEEVLARLDPDNHPSACALAALPEQVRGFGAVRAAAAEQARARRAELLAALGARRERPRAA